MGFRILEILFLNNIFIRLVAKGTVPLNQFLSASNAPIKYQADLLDSHNKKLENVSFNLLMKT